jgi:hypothetical protein
MTHQKQPSQQKKITQFFSHDSARTLSTSRLSDSSLAYRKRERNIVENDEIEFRNKKQKIDDLSKKDQPSSSTSTSTTPTITSSNGHSTCSTSIKQTIFSIPRRLGTRERERQIFYFLHLFVSERETFSHAT